MKHDSILRVLAVIIAIAAILTLTSSAFADETMVYYQGYGKIAVTDDTTMGIWKEQISDAKEVGNSRYEFWSNPKKFGPSDWCDVVEYLDEDADLSTDTQGRWVNADLFKLKLALNAYAADRRAKHYAAVKVAKRAKEEAEARAGRITQFCPEFEQEYKKLEALQHAGGMTSAEFTKKVAKLRATYGVIADSLYNIQLQREAAEAKARLAQMAPVTTEQFNELQESVRILREDHNDLDARVDRLESEIKEHRAMGYKTAHPKR